MVSNAFYKRAAYLCSAIMAFHMVWTEIPEEHKAKAMAKFSHILERPMVIYEQAMTLENPWQIVRLPLLAIAFKLLARFFRRRVERDEAAQPQAAETKPGVKGGDGKGGPMRSERRQEAKTQKKDKAA